MMPYDTLTCQVTPDSVEPTSLSCSMPPLDNLELWDAINSLLATMGAWATVGATLLLAYFAWRAWNTSQATLKAMERQMEDQSTAAQNAIDAQFQLSTDTRQRALLADYCVNLRRVGVSSIGIPIDRVRESNEFMARNIAAESAWNSWAMELHASAPEFRALTQEWDEALRQGMAHDHLREIGITPDTSVGRLTAEGQEVQVSALTRAYILQLQTWQVNPALRAGVERKLSVDRKKYIV